MTGRYVSVGPRGAGWSMCEDCGALILRTETHDRFHAILNDQARAIAVLITSHVGPKVHDRYNVSERIGSRSETSWSADAFTEVTESEVTFDPKGLDKR